MVNDKPVCVYCKSNSAHCNVVTNKGTFRCGEEGEVVFNCLGNHKVMHCNSKNCSTVCHRKHHTLYIIVVCACHPVKHCKMHLYSPIKIFKTHPTIQSNSVKHVECCFSFTLAQFTGNYTTAIQPLLDTKGSFQCLMKMAKALVRVGNTISLQIYY